MSTKAKPDEKSKCSQVLSRQRQWDALQSEAPIFPKGTATIEELTLLRHHKTRVKYFLAALPEDERKAFTSNKKRKQSATMTIRMKEETSLVADSPPSLLKVDITSDAIAEALADRLNGKPTYLTLDGSSWIIHIKKWMPTPDSCTFCRHWDVHPTEFHELKLFGKIYYQNRWSLSWGHDYRYSGSVSKARKISDNDEESQMVSNLIKKANDLVDGIISDGSEFPYNGCLQNWYEVDHTIGSHSDDEKDLKKGFPIFSLSWGGTRRFVLKARSDSPSPCVAKTTDVMLSDGDLLVMGGICQSTHKHEVPKRRATKDPPTSARINWTIRAFRSEG